MTKGELRRARKAAVADGRSWLLPSRSSQECNQEFTETPKGRDALDKWARRYDELNGAPEGDWDR